MASIKIDNNLFSHITGKGRKGFTKNRSNIILNVSVWILKKNWSNLIGCNHSKIAHLGLDPTKMADTYNLDIHLIFKLFLKLYYTMKC